MKTGIELVKEMCRALNLDREFCTPVLREVLKMGGKDLRSAPLVKKVLESMENKTQDNVLKALEITKKKAETLNQGEYLHPNYFVAVINNKKNHSHYDDDINLNWGNSI